MKCEITFVIPDGAYQAVEDTMKEMDRQVEQWGVQNHHPAYWLAILGKQVGQLGSAVLDREWAADTDKGTAILRHEAVQAAAVALALIECIDRGDMPLGLVTAKPLNPRQLAKALGIGDESVHERHHAGDEYWEDVPQMPRGYDDVALPPGTEPCL